VDVGGLREDNSESVRTYFRSVRPSVGVLVLMAYIAPLPVAIAYDQTRSDRDSMLFWLGSGSYALFGLVCVAIVWFCHAGLFAITRFDRLRRLVLNEGADHVAFDRKSRGMFIIASVVLVLYLVLFCVLSRS
jgi:hypothetical protein